MASNITSKAFGGGQLLEELYHELHRLAEARMRSLPPGQTIQPTALVHEAFLKIGGVETRWHKKSEFFAAAARAMRNIMVDEARRKGAMKHGGDRQRIPFDESLIEAASAHAPLHELDAALTRLESESPRKAEVVSLRFFAGLTIEQVAACLEVSHATVERDWSFARAWLRRELTTCEPDDSENTA